VRKLMKKRRGKGRKDPGRQLRLDYLPKLPRLTQTQHINMQGKGDVWGDLSEER